MPSRTILVEVNRYDAFLHGRGQADSEEEAEKEGKKRREKEEETTRLSRSIGNAFPCDIVCDGEKERERKREREREKCRIGAGVVLKVDF